MWVYVFVMLAIVVGGFIVLNRETDEQRQLYANLCPCFHTWLSLDARWNHLHIAAAQVANDLSWTTLSIICAVVGQLFGWFVGAPFLRVPLDEMYFDMLHRNSLYYGCIRGPQALVSVYVSTSSHAEKWCPTKARLRCQGPYYCTAVNSLTTQPTAAQQ